MIYFREATFAFLFARKKVDFKRHKERDEADGDDFRVQKTSYKMLHIKQGSAHLPNRSRQWFPGP